MAGDRDGTFSNICPYHCQAQAHGLPQLVVSDNGTVFTSGEFKEFLERNEIRHVRSSPCHPASNGLAEWYVQTFKTTLKKSGDVDVQQQLSQFFSVIIPLRIPLRGLHLLNC